MARRHKIHLSDLSPTYQRQAASKWAAAEGEKRRKYGNTPTTVNGIRFDSRKEAARYAELLELLEAGAIRNLRLQPQFTLVEGYKDAFTGKSVRPLRYVADFSYEEWTETGKPGPCPWRWLPVVEDVKGRKTREYLTKKKLLYDKFQIQIRET